MPQTKEKDIHKVSRDRQMNCW